MALTKNSIILIDEINDAVKSFTVNGKKVTFTRLDGTTGNFTTQDTTYSNMTAATASAAGKAGLVPAPSAGANTKFLRGDATWQLITGLTLPAGSIIAFAGNPSSAPSGYLLCNGAAVSRTTYAALFAAIGTTYGAGNGSTTFNLPNLADKFIQGSDTAGTVKEAGLPNVYGWASGIFSYQFSGSGALSYSTNITSRGGTAEDNGGAGFNTLRLNASDYNTIYGASTTVQPPAVTMRYYIKY